MLFLNLVLMMFLVSCSLSPVNRNTSTAFEKLPLPAMKSDYLLMDAEGAAKRLLATQDKDFAVLTFVQYQKYPLPPALISNLQKLSNLAKDNSLKDFAFSVISVNEIESREELLKITSAVNLPNHILSDATQLSAIDAGVGKVLDSAIVHRKSRKIVGVLNVGEDPGFKLKLLSLLGPDAKPLEAVSGKIPLRLSTEATSAGIISFEKQVAPILIRNCVNCHREGGLAPWAMKDYQSLMSWKKMMREVLLLKRMPPGQSDNYHREYSNEVRPSAAEIRKLVRWLDQASPVLTEERDPLKELILPPVQDFKLGKPDLILDIPEQQIGASENEFVKVLKLNWPLSEPVRIKGMDVQTDNTRSTHHLSMYYLVPSSKIPSTHTVNMFDGGYIAGYEPMFLPYNASYLIPASAPIRVSPHLVPTGRNETVKMRAAFYFDNSKEPNELFSCAVDAKDIDIPPFAAKYQKSAEGIVSEDVRVIQVGTHMHSRGKSIKFSATLPDGSRHVLLSLPNYNRNWQREYALAKPMFLPKGTRVTCDATYDNSPSNPRVSDPSKRITYGWYADNEMMTCSCFAMRESDYQRSLGKSKVPYKPVPVESDRNAVVPVLK